MHQTETEKIAAALRRVRELKPLTPAGLWAKEDATRKLERDLMDAHQAEREQLAKRETGELCQIAGLPTTL